MADYYPDIVPQSKKTSWTPISQQITVFGPNNKPYVGDDGRNLSVLHYNVKLVHDLIDNNDLDLIYTHYNDNNLFRFFFVAPADGTTYNCMYKSQPEVIKGENHYWVVTSFFIASSTILT